MPENVSAYLTRITWNDNRWARPSKHGSEDSYVGENGFGHEEWLNRREWVDHGWRYAFIQGVYKSQPRLAGINPSPPVLNSALGHGSTLCKRVARSSGADG